MTSREHTPLIQCIFVGVPIAGKFKALIRMYIPRSKHVNAAKRKTQ